MEESMRKVVVLMHLTLNGVMQAPGRPDEDVRGGFAHGGWALPRGDALGAVDVGLGSQGALLLGRRTYEDFYGFWPRQGDNPFTTMLTSMQKYVASTTLREPLPWSNSTLLPGDAAEAVTALKAEPGPDLLVMGSGVLVQALMRQNLVDRYVLLIHPLVLRDGRRLFPEGGPAGELQLVEATTTPSGVIVATYRPAAKSTAGAA
jgi:dihydrofolate reductase